MPATSPKPGTHYYASGLTKVFFLTALLAALAFLSACSSGSSGAANFKGNILAGKKSPIYSSTPLKPLNLDGDVIDMERCTWGLSGDLSTSRAGRHLVAALGQEGDGPVEMDSQPPAAMRVTVSDITKSGSGESLRLKAGLTSRLLTTAYEQTGRHYQAGGQAPRAGFDSAGYVKWVYSQQGVSVPAGIQKQVTGGRPVAREDLRPGDLLVYRAPGGGEGYQVGIFTGQGNFIHASPQAKVVTETAAFGPQYNPLFVGGRRYYDDPKAAALPEARKSEATSSAVKLALAELGPSDKPAKYSAPARKPAAPQKAVSKKGKGSNVKVAKASKGSKAAAKPRKK